MSFPAWRAALLMVALLLVTVLAAVPAEAHRQGLRPGYERLLYDCSHDWGWESGYPLEKGHDFVTLDINETTIDGVALVLFEVNFVRSQPQVFGSAVGLRERLVVETPRVTIDTTIETTGEWADGPRFVSGTEPAYLGPRKAGITEGGGPDNTLIAYDLGYRYDQLQAKNLETVAGYEVWAYYQDLGTWKPGDYLAGGYHTGSGAFVEGCRKADGNDPAQDASYFQSAGFTLRKSDWDPGASDASDDDAAGSTDPAATASPVADFTWSPTNPSSQDLVVFADASVPGDGDLTSWAWKVGTSWTETGQTMTHSFDAPGRYWVQLSVVDDNGQEATVRKEVVVRNLPPVAAIAPVGNVTAGAPVHFQDESTDVDGRIVSWAWRFGDGAEAFEASPQHVYAEPGTYTVQLTVTDDRGAERTATLVVDVAPVASPVSEQAPAASASFAIIAAALALLMRRRD